MLPSPVPHPLAWPGLNVPGWARGLFESVLGGDWPEGDETKAWDLADLWYEVAAALDGPRDEAAIAAREVTAAFGGTTDLAHGFAAAFLAVADGDRAPLPGLLLLTDEIARLVEECGRDIEAAKLDVWIELGVFAAELAALGIAMACTAGTGAPAAGAAVAASRLAIARILQRLVARLARKVLRPGAQDVVEVGVRQASERGLGGPARRFGTADVIAVGREPGIGSTIDGYQSGDARRRTADVGVPTPDAFAGVDRIAGDGAEFNAGDGAEFNAEGGTEFFERIGREAGGERPGENVTGRDATGGLHPGGASTVGTRSDVTADALNDRLGAQALADSRSVDGPVVAGAAPPTADPAVPVGDPARATVPGAQVTTGVPVHAPARPEVPSPPRHDPPAPRHESSSPRHDPPAPRHEPSAVRYEAPEPVRRDPAPRHDPTPAPRAEAPSRADGPTVAGVTTPVRPDPVSLAPPAAADVVSPARPDPSPTTVSSDRATSASVTTPASTSTSAFAAGSAPSGTGGYPGAPHSGPAGPGAVGSGPAGSSAVAHGPAAAGPAGHAPAGSGSGSGSGGNASSGGAAGQSAGAGVRSDGLVRAAPVDQDGLDVATDVEPADADPAALDRERPDPAPAVDNTVVVVVPFLGLPSFAKTPRQSAEESDLRGYGRYLTMLRQGLELTRTADTAAALARVIAGHQLRAATSRRWYDHHVARGEQGTADLWWQQHVTDSAKLDRARADQAALLASDRIPGTVPVPDRTWATADRHAGLLVDVPPPADAKTRPTAANTRPYGRRGGLRPPLRLHQSDLSRVVPRDPDGTFARHPDPGAGWIRYANDGGAGADATRGNNCIDCVAALFSTWNGNPEVAAPRTDDAQENGGVLRPVGGEVDGPARLETLTGGTFQAVLPDTATLDPSAVGDLRATAFTDLAAQLRAAGPGAFAALISEARDGRTHAWAAVNKDGTVHYVDPQLGTTADQPLYPDVTRFDALVVNADGVSYPLADRDVGRWSAAGLAAADLDALASLDPTSAARRAASPPSGAPAAVPQPASANLPEETPGTPDSPQPGTSGPTVIRGTNHSATPRSTGGAVDRRSAGAPHATVGAAVGMQWPTTIEEALAEQERLRARLDLTDPGPVRLRAVAGLDVAYHEDGARLAAAVVVLDAVTLAVLDTAVATGRPAFGYVPGLFAFREVPALLAALGKLTVAPEVLICDGHGLAHPRRFGLACHLGVLTGLPAFGVGKTPLVGRWDGPGSQRGAWAPLEDGGEIVGRVVRTRDGIKPVVVSVGHRVSLDRATELTIALTPRFRLPETTRAADQACRQALVAATGGG